jgi:hypothetical protein
MTEARPEPRTGSTVTPLIAAKAILDLLNFLLAVDT